MTNIEWLRTLTPRQLAFFMIDTAPKIGAQYNVSELGLYSWLMKTYTPDDQFTQINIDIL